MEGLPPALGLPGLPPATAMDNLTATPTLPWAASSFAEDVLNITSTVATSKSRYSLTEVIVIAILAGSLSIITVVGNSMVMISFKIDKQLQTISNYFLFR